MVSLPSGTSQPLIPQPVPVPHPLQVAAPESLYILYLYQHHLIHYHYCIPQSPFFLPPSPTAAAAAAFLMPHYLHPVPFQAGWLPLPPFFWIILWARTWDWSVSSGRSWFRLWKAVDLQSPSPPSPVHGQPPRGQPRGWARGKVKVVIPPTTSQIEHPAWKGEVIGLIPSLDFPFSSHRWTIAAGLQILLHATYPGISKSHPRPLGTSQSILLTLKWWMSSSTAFLPSSLGDPHLCRLWQGCPWGSGKVRTLYWICWQAVLLKTCRLWHQLTTGTQDGRPSDASVQPGSFPRPLQWNKWWQSLRGKVVTHYSSLASSFN